jgi:hypothetical protein
MQSEATAWVRHQVALRAARVAIATLEHGGVAALPVKGVLLAHQVYDPALRPLHDIDLLVRPRDLSRALRIARSLGWSVVWDSKQLGNPNVVIHGMAVDLANSVGPPGVSALGVDAMIGRARRAVDPLGFPHWQVELHDHALLVALDAFKDKLGSKPWSREDLTRLARVTGFSASALVERAAEAKLSTMLAIVADWVVEAGPSPAWSAVRDYAAQSHARPRYAQRYRSLLEKEESTWKRWYLGAQTRAVSDSSRRRCLALTLGALGTLRYWVRHGRLDGDPWQRRS